MVNTRDFMTLLLARLKVTDAKKLKKAKPQPTSIKPKSALIVARPARPYQPEPPRYRPASNM